MSDLPKKNKYTKEFAIHFLDMCKQGKTLTTIASTFGVLKEKLLSWSKDPRKPEFITAWALGKEACQAYHEDLLDKMINKEVKSSASEIDAQKYRLRVMFKEDWSDKQESKIEVSHIDRMTDDELENAIKQKAAKPNVARKLNELINVVPINKTGTDK